MSFNRTRLKYVVLHKIRLLNVHFFIYYPILGIHDDFCDIFLKLQINKKIKVDFIYKLD